MNQILNIFSLILLLNYFIFNMDIDSKVINIESNIEKDSLKDDLKITLLVLNESEIEITVKNVSNKVIKAYSHVETYEKHFDYIEIEAITPDFDKMYFSFYDDREKSAPIIVELKPNESFSHKIDLISWSEREINSNTIIRAGLNHLPHGIKIRAKYRNSACENCNEYYKSIWTGFIYSEWIEF